MKFGKQLETEAEGIPSEWRPYLIQYKSLKKLIGKLANEIEHRGLSASLLRECLSIEDSDSFEPNKPRIEYYFTGEPPNVHPCIRFTYDHNLIHIDRLVEQLVEDPQHDTDREQERARPKLHYSRTENDTDFFTLSGQTSPATGQATPTDETDDLYLKDINQRRRSAVAALIRELMERILTDRQSSKIEEVSSDTSTDEGHIDGDNDDANDTGDLEQNKEDQKNHDSDHKQSDGQQQDAAEETKQPPESPRPSSMRSLVIDLEHDDEFFSALMSELEQATQLQTVTKQKFEYDVHALEQRMTKVASPQHESDMYAWRIMFAVYMDAQIFRGKVEADRSIRSVTKSRKQLEWFLEQLEKQNIMSRFRGKASREAFEQFLALNTELIAMKHYHLLNQTALTKILKKHDKRSGLTASTHFPSLIQEHKLFSPNLADVLCSSLLTQVITIIPQPDDYACPVCMAVAWRPIRLECGHVFCVRCLIKAQKKNMSSCPVCRHPKAVKMASARNLDLPMQNFMRLYFPKEIKEKKKDNEREQAIEEVQAFTGRVYTEEQLIQMNRQSDSPCTIM